MSLSDQLSAFHPWNEQEKKDLDLILFCLRTRPDVFLRSDRLCHMTASAWTVSRKHDRVLMAFHNIYQSWSWLGGHADGEQDLLSVALREVREESGIFSVFPVIRDPFSVEVLTVDGHTRRGEYVSSHLHLNVTYLLEVDDSVPPSGNPDENSGIAWFSPEKAVSASSEPWFRDHVYDKLNRKMAAFFSHR